MPNLSIKNVPPELYERLKHGAAASRRSLNSEIIHRLEQSVGAAAIDVDTLAAEMRLVRERPGVPYLTDAALRRERERGRA